MYRAMLTLGCFAASQAFGHTPVIVELFETDDWCAVIAAGYGGDTYLFHPGDYYGPCEVVGPEPDMGGERLMMESYDPQNPAVFHHDGSAEYILTLSGTAVSLRYVALGSLPAGVDGVRLGGVDMHIRGLAGEQLAGRAIVTVADLRGLEVIESELTHVSGTGIEVGCADCRVVNVLLEDNLIVGATRGVEVTHGVWGTARDNFIGGGVHGIRWVGTPTESLLEENFVGGSGVGIDVQGGGAVLLRNNLVAGAPAMLLAGPGTHRVLGNSLYSAREGLVITGEDPASQVELRNNAISGGVPDLGLGVVDGNVACVSPGDCWVDASAWDFYPAPDSALRSQGVELPWGDLVADWCGRPRPTVPTVGGLEAVSVLGFGPVELVSRDAFDCTVPPDPATPADTGTTTTDPTASGSDTAADPGGSVLPKRRDDASCGCRLGTPGPSGVAGTVALLLLAIRRRR